MAEVASGSPPEVGRASCLGGIAMATSIAGTRTVRRRMEVSGIVQGVGFRPYVYRLAKERALGGAISNTAAGVVIEIEGTPAAVEDFVAVLPVQAPPLARITATAIHVMPTEGENRFRILESRAGDVRSVLISPDVAVCPDCLREL